MLICTKLIFAQDNLQRYYLNPPYKGQISAYSDWTIPETAWTELTNCYVDEQGKIVMRPGFYCWIYPVTTSIPIDGANLYKYWNETGFDTRVVYQSINRIYKTITGETAYGGGNNVRISPLMATGYTEESYFNNDGIPSWIIYYNDLFMANGYDGAIQYNGNNSLIAELGRSFCKASVEFQDTNVIEIVKISGDTVNVKGSDYTFATGHYWLHFRVGMDLTITDSNNNDTYEIIAADANLITVSTTTGGNSSWSSEESDSSVTLYAYSFPDDISTSRTATVTYTNSDSVVFDADNRTICDYPVSWRHEGFIDGMSLTLSGSSSNDGTYVIEDVGYEAYWCLLLDANATLTSGTDTSTITFTGSQALSNGMDCFNPTAIAGHKGRLFAGGISEYPTKLYWSQSIFRDQYYWDLWRDSYGEKEGTGHYDIRDKIIALIGEWRDMLVVFCENSIHYLKGDDPGFDTLTPSQSLIFHPVPISQNIGCIGPNAWCEAEGDIYFYSKEGLRKLSIIEQKGEAQFTIISLPIKDLHDDIMENRLEKTIDMEYLKALNMILINVSIGYRDNAIIIYNLTNGAFSKWIFYDGSEPSSLFIAPGPDLDSDSDYPSDTAKPNETVWFSSWDGKLWALNQAYTHDKDYSDPNSASLHSISMTAISAKLNMGQPYLEKNFERAVFFCSPQINYDDASQGQVSFYRKVDDGSWSSAFTKSFTQHTEADGTIIDYYEYLDPGVGFKGTGKTIQIKIGVSGTTGRFGLEFVGAMIEWLPKDYRT